MATTAQYSSGDILVMASQQGRPLVLGITQSGTVFTASPTAPVAGYSEILPSADNRTTWFAAAGRGLFALSPSGQWSTVTATMPGVALNVDGTGMLLAAGFGGTIYGYDVRGTQYTLAAYPSNFSFHGLLYDPRSGDILWDVGSAFLSVSPYQTRASTIFASAGPIFSGQPVWSPETDSAFGWGMSGLVGLGLSPPFTRRRLPLPPTIIYRVVERNPRTGRLLASHEDSLSVVRLYDVDPSSGAVVGTLLVARVDSDACVAHARHVAPGGPAVRGQPWQFLVSFPSHPGAAYVTVASFGVGSGVRLPTGRRVFLRPDPLTLLSLSGSPLFDRFHGYLDSGGEAIAAVRIPRSANLAGTRFFVVSLVMRGGLVAGVSDPVGVTIR